MQNLYLPEMPDKQVGNLKPRKETIRFLLDYSKALSVNKSHDKEFELLLN